MKMIPVASSNLASVGYEAGKHELYIRFNSGALYVYFNVPESIYSRLMNAPSKGHYHAEYIKNRFQYRRIE